MKNNALKILSLALVLPLMAGCNNNNKKEEGPIWSTEIDAEMMQYLGDVLPFVQLNEETMYHEYSDAYEGYGIGLYYIGDDNENNVVADYGAKLEEAGWTFVEDDEGDYYSKEVNEFELICSFDWYEASEEYEAGNEISVQCPIYVEPVTEESLIAAGYQKVNGWPSEDVLEVLTDSYNISPINENGEWFTSGIQLLEDMFGNEYYGIYLATHSDVTEEANTSLLADGYYWDEDYQAYYSSDDETMVAVGLNNGFTLFEIYGPYLQPEQGEVASETAKQDGSIDVAFTFAGNLLDGTSYEETFESTSASLTTAKGGNQNNAPTYYDSGSSLRCYYKNTLTITAAEGLTINSVVIEVGFVKNLSANDMTASSGTLTSTGTAAPATITISGVNAASLIITVGPNASKGNIGFSSITVNVSSAQ